MVDRDPPRVLQVLEELSPLRFEMLGNWPTTTRSCQGGRKAGDPSGQHRSHFPTTLRDGFDRAPENRDGSPADAPSNDGVVFRGPVRGHVLIGTLLSALVSHGVEVRAGARPTRLLPRATAGCRIELDGEEIRAKVIVATGGFQHDPDLATSFLRAPDIAPMGTPGCAGDGLRMVMSAGASIANMGEGWWMPAVHLDSEELDGSTYFRPLHSERAQPGAVMVDRRGRRFVNEAQNYGDVGRAMQAFEPEPDWFPALPCWLVFDAACRARVPIGPLLPGDPDPGWLHRADSLEALAVEIGVPQDTFVSTIDRFNKNAVLGEDPDFKRGSHHYDRWIGDRATPHPTLGALCDAPSTRSESTADAWEPRGVRAPTSLEGFSGWQER